MLMVNLVDRVVPVEETVLVVQLNLVQQLNQDNRNQQELQTMDLLGGLVHLDVLMEMVVVEEVVPEVLEQVVLEVPEVLEYKHHRHLEILPQQ